MSRKFKILCALICTALLILSMCVSAAAVFLEGANIQELPQSSFTSVPVYLNGEHIGEALKTGGTCYVPLSDFCEKLLGESCLLRYNSESATLNILSPSLELSFDLARHYALVNGRYIYLQGGVFNVEGSVHIPIRVLAKAFAADLSWETNGDKASIQLSRSPGSLIVSGEEFYDQEELYWLSHVIYAESGNQPLEGMIGVGNVVLNRVRDESGAFPDTIHDVIFQPGQFSVVDSGAIFLEPKPDCVIAAKLCLEGCNTVGDSLFFLNPSISGTEWFDTYRVFRLSIGEHYFYA